MVGNMFVSDDGPVRPDQLRACNFALLALYEAVHLNRNFIATLGHYQTEATAITSLDTQSTLVCFYENLSNATLSQIFVHFFQNIDFFFNTSFPRKSTLA